MVVYHRAVDAVDAVTHIDRDGFLFFGLAFLQIDPPRAPRAQGRAKVTANATQHRSVQL